jgi:uncharacterized protein (TIGR02147 family)
MIHSLRLFVKRIYEYLDYREFMKDHYNSTREEHSYISFRYLEQKTGIDASYYAKVINKQKHIAVGSIPSLAQFFCFNKRETDYFTHLVSFCKARQQEQIEYHFKKMLYLRDPSSRHLEEKMYRYFQQWYTVVIRELLNTFEFKGDYSDLASRVEPTISPAQARQSVKLLEELGLVEIDNEGCYRLTDQFLTTDKQLRSLAVREFQRSMIRLAGEALDRFKAEQRDISSLTISTNIDCLELIREKLDATRKEILQMVAEHDGTSDDVYQLNIQVFPVSQNLRNGKSRGMKKVS